MTDSVLAPPLMEIRGGAFPVSKSAAVAGFDRGKDSKYGKDVER